MPSRRSSGKRLCVIGVLAVAVCISATAQGTGSGAVYDKEAQFQTLLKQGFDLHQQARFAEAIPVLERARTLEPQDYFANLLLGIDLLRTGKATDAIPRLELAARVKTDEETPDDYLGEALAGSRPL